jgi:glycosyltransferase involved in cell wall biosynthesis
MIDTLRSIVKQTISKSVEVIVIDDGSKIPIRLQDIPRFNGLFNLRIHRHQYNRGLSAARNTGAILSLGQYIIFLDPDDLVEETALEKLLLLKRQHEGLGHKVGFIYPSTVHFIDDPKRPNSIERVPFSHQKLLRENYIPSFALIERQLYLQVGGMCENHIKYFEDYDFWLRLVSLGYRGILLDEPLFFYRRHDSGRSTIIKKNVKDWKEELRANNPVAFGDILADKDDEQMLTIKECPCCRPMPQEGQLNLWLWRHHSRIPKLPSPKRTVTTELQPIVEFTQVLMIVPWLQVGGADYYDLDVIKVISHSNNITIITDDIKTDHPLKSQFLTYTRDIFHLASLLPPSYDTEQVDNLLDHFIESRRPKIVYVRNSMNGYRLASRHHGRGIKFIDVQHLATASDNLGWEYSSIPFISFLDSRLVVSRHLAKIIEDTAISNHQQSPPTFIIPPSVDVASLKGDKSLQLCGGDYRTVLFVGRLVEQKDPELWIQVASELASRDQRILFLMIGEGSLRDQVLHDFDTYPSLKDRFLISPFTNREELAKFLCYGLERDSVGILRPASCLGKTVLLMTSQNEGIPIVILEAAAVGVPIVIGNVGAISEMKEKLADSIRLVTSQSINEYADQVLTAFNDNDQLRDRPLPREYSKEHFHEKILELFNSLLFDY